MRLHKFGRGKYSKNTSYVDFQDLELKIVAGFCFMILNIHSLL